MHFALKRGPYKYLKSSWAASGSCWSTSIYQGVLNKRGSKKTVNNNNIIPAGLFCTSPGDIT